MGHHRVQGKDENISDSNEVPRDTFKAGVLNNWRGYKLNHYMYPIVDAGTPADGANFHPRPTYRALKKKIFRYFFLRNVITTYE